jgi:hypothetical protein
MFAAGGKQDVCNLALHYIMPIRHGRPAACERTTDFNFMEGALQ